MEIQIKLPLACKPRRVFLVACHALNGCVCPQNDTSVKIIPEFGSGKQDAILQPFFIVQKRQAASDVINLCR